MESNESGQNPTDEASVAPTRGFVRRFALPGVVVAAAVALIALLIFGVSSHTDTASIDARVASGKLPLAPNYTTKLPELNSSKEADLASFKGKVVLMNVYASWCPPCQAEAPIMAKEQNVLAEHGATLVGVTYLDNAGATDQFDHRYGLHYPVLRDVNGTFVRSFGTFGVPESFVINKQGRIVALSRGPVSMKWLNAHVGPLIGQKA
jgi:cytochrome c biogenesis protein CcmG/thiol:disulfide interchange protein DsbE